MECPAIGGHGVGGCSRRMGCTCLRSSRFETSFGTLALDHARLAAVADYSEGKIICIVDGLAFAPPPVTKDS